jgi:hypothetical protein
MWDEPVVPAPAPGAKKPGPPPPPPKGTAEFEQWKRNEILAAVRTEGRHIGAQHGKLLAEYEGALAILQTKWGGVSMWERMSEAEKRDWVERAGQEFDKLPQLPKYDTPEKASAALEGLDKARVPDT